MNSKKLSLTRRHFLKTAGASVAAFSIVPRCVLPGSGATPPSEKLNVAGIGVGGRGADDIHGIAPGNNMVALCDVDSRHAGPTFKEFPNAKVYQDFRKMFDEMEKDIDAVVVATPDHTHAVAAMAALDRRKPLYCEKPLAHSVYEVRALMKKAKEQNVVTQLGNQGHSFNTIRDFCEWVWDGAIGEVHTVHCGCEAVNSALDQLPQLSEHHPVPPTLDWDQWLGPAKERPYHPAYLPGSWRGWTPFGNGTIGDWACHVIDPVFWALDLGAPTTIQAEVKDYDYKTQGDAFPKGDKIRYEFPAKGKRGPVTLFWYSGTERIPRPAALDEDEKVVGTGAVVLGDKGTIMYGSHGAGGVRILPQSKMDAYQRPAKTIPRVKDHYADWLRAVRTGGKAGSDIPTYGGPLTEVAMLGVIAIKLAGTKLEWDAEKMQFTNSSEANDLVQPPYRSGWSL